MKRLALIPVLLTLIVIPACGSEQNTDPQNVAEMTIEEREKFSEEMNEGVHELNKEIDKFNAEN